MGKLNNHIKLKQVHSKKRPKLWSNLTPGELVYNICHCLEKRSPCST